MIMYTLVAVLLVAGQFPFGSSSIPDGNDLKALCAGRPIRLISVTELLSLVEQLKQSTCPDHIRDAIVDLSKLIERDSEDVCTMDKVNGIKDYYAKHLDNSDRASVRDNKVPKSLERFAVAYAMQVSSHCKLHMLRVLFEKGADSLKANNFERLKEWTRDGGAVANLLDALAEPGDIVLPSDLVAVLPDKMSIARKLESESHFGMIMGAKQVCQEKFKPIYEPVVRPVAALSRAGFDIPDILLNFHERGHLEVLEESTTKWLQVVFLCESLDMIDTETNIKVLDYLYAIPSDMGPETMNNQKPSGGVGSLLIPDYDKELARRLNSFSTSKTESDRIKDKLMRRSWRLLKARFKRGEYGALFKSALKKMIFRKSSKKLESINKEIIDLLEAKKEGSVYHALSHAVKPIEAYVQQALGAMVVMDILKVTGLTHEEVEKAKQIED